MADIWPVILSGGSGKRLWPLSRKLYPKQFQALTSDVSLFQECAQRVGPDFSYRPPSSSAMTIIVSSPPNNYGSRASRPKLSCSNR